MSAAVGVIGLGAMGRPMAARLLAAGRDVVGYDVAASARALHAEAGGRTADSAAAVARAVDVVVTSLPSAEALDEVIVHLGHERRERPLVVIETSTLELHRKTAARDRAREFGLVLVDAPVSGTAVQARRGDLVFYASSDDRRALDTARAVLADIGRAIHDVGAFGNGTLTKLAANALVAVHNLAAAEALLLARRSGLDVERTLRALVDGAGCSRMLEVRGPLMAAGNYRPANARVAIFRKDLRAIRALAAEVGSPLPLLDIAAAHYDLAAARGRADEDTACVFAVLDEVPRIEQKGDHP